MKDIKDFTDNWESYKHKETDKITWIALENVDGEFWFTFDGVHCFNLFADYPHNLTKEQKSIFDKENPYWVDFFKDRL